MLLRQKDEQYLIKEIKVTPIKLTSASIVLSQTDNFKRYESYITSFFPQELNSVKCMFKGELFVVIQTTSKYVLLDVQQYIGVCAYYYICPYNGSPELGARNFTILEEEPMFIL